MLFCQNQGGNGAVFHIQSYILILQKKLKKVMTDWMKLAK